MTTGALTKYLRESLDYLNKVCMDPLSVCCCEQGQCILATPKNPNQCMLYLEFSPLNLTVRHPFLMRNHSYISQIWLPSPSTKLLVKSVFLAHRIKELAGLLLPQNGQFVCVTV